MNEMTALKIRLMQKVSELPNNKQFTMRLIRPDTWVVTPFNPSPDTPRIHVLVGKERALVIDPTDTPYDVRKFIEENITDLPLAVANTHSHRDHTYANYLFDDCQIYMSEQCSIELSEQHRRPVTDPVSVALGMTHVSRNEGTIVKRGDVIDLGEREIEVLGITPCYSPGSILFLDRTRGILFTGDEIDPGQVNVWNQPVETFRGNVMKLLDRRDEFDMICSPHNGTPYYADTLRYFVENCDRIMSGIEGELDVGSTSYLLNPFEPRPKKTVDYRRFDPLTRRSFWKGTAINYNIDLIHNADLKKPYRKAYTNPPEGWEPGDQYPEEKR